MNTAVVSSIIGTVGAGLIAVLILYLQSLRDDIRALGVRIDGMESGLRTELGERIDGMGSSLRTELGERIDGVESKLAGIEERLVRIETIQEEHGRTLDAIADHGERISALEGAVAAMS